MKLLGEGIGQLRVFLLFFAVGALIGILYTFGAKLTKTRLSAVLFDFLFCTAVVFAVFAINLRYNNGEARFFVFAALAIGVATAYFICRKPLDKLCQVVYNLLTSQNGRQENGTTVLQKVNIYTHRSGDTASGSTALHTTDNPVAKGVVKQ